ncbi:MAG: T9SS type A sorting domain-containing protein [Tannerella sp.]|jgi:hypothetical protein|nr:T9SS type A sorting domain-containing protein [Tannerella sp.]
MKKMKFTLGLILSMLFVGVNVINAELKPVDPSKPYGDGPESGKINVTLNVKASQSFYNTLSKADFGDKQIVANNDAIIIKKVEEEYIPGDENKISYTSPPLTGQDIRLNDLSGFGIDSWNYGNNYNDFNSKMNQYIDDNIKYFHTFSVNLSFDHGKEVIPFLKRKVFTSVGKWNYDTEKEINVWVEDITIEELLMPYEISDKTQFTDGSGVATYTYKSEILPLASKYVIRAIVYELWTNDQIGSEPGDGSAYPIVNHAITFKTEEGISINPAKDVHYVLAHQDYTFEVYGEEGKDLNVTTNNRYYAVGKGIKVDPDPINEGKWNVTISKVSANLELTIGYISDTKGGELGDYGDENSNATVEKDAVWAAGGVLYVKTGTSGTLSIYNITGQLYKQEAISGNYTLSMPKGIYILQLNGKAYKVIL